MHLVCTLLISVYLQTYLSFVLIPGGFGLGMGDCICFCSFVIQFSFPLLVMPQWEEHALALDLVGNAAVKSETGQSNPPKGRLLNDGK